MIRVLIIDSNITVIKQLEKIAVDKGIGIVVGYAQDGQTALNKIKELMPDLVLIEYKIPKIDGISLIKKVKKFNKNIQFIMISEENSKFIIEQAYRSGIEYYIHKPISSIEIENVIDRAVKEKEINSTLVQIQKLINKNSSSSVPRYNQSYNDCEEKIKHVMQDIGIYGETGTQEMIQLIKHLIDNDKNIDDYTIKELCSYFTENPKWMEQRIRRLATSGMVNLSNLGIEDYMNETFTEYSNSIYNFEQVKKEMDYIRGKSKERGKINLKKFISGLVFYSEK